MNNILWKFAGAWRGHEQIQSSKWGEGGLALSSVTSELRFDDRLLVQDYAAQRDGKDWFDAHAVFSFDANDGSYRLFWFDSLGFVPEQAASGTWNGESLTFIRISPRGQTRHVYTPVSDYEYSMRLESSFDGGANWILVMEGRYSRHA